MIVMKQCKHDTWWTFRTVNKNHSIYNKLLCCFFAPKAWAKCDLCHDLMSSEFVKLFTKAWSNGAFWMFQLRRILSNLLMLVVILKIVQPEKTSRLAGTTHWLANKHCPIMSLFYTRIVLETPPLPLMSGRGGESSVYTNIPYNTKWAIGKAIWNHKDKYAAHYLEGLYIYSHPPPSIGKFFSYSFITVFEPQFSHSSEASKF